MYSGIVCVKLYTHTQSIAVFGVICIEHQHCIAKQVALDAAKMKIYNVAQLSSIPGIWNFKPIEQSYKKLWQPIKLSLLVCRDTNVTHEVY